MVTTMPGFIPLELHDFLRQLEFGPCLQMTHETVKPGRGSETVFSHIHFGREPSAIAALPHHMSFDAHMLFLTMYREHPLNQVLHSSKKTLKTSNLIWNSDEFPET